MLREGKPVPSSDRGAQGKAEVSGSSPLTLASAATLPADDVVARLNSDAGGLSHDEASARLAEVGPNALRSHGARPFEVLARQLRNPLLLLLAAAAVTSFAVGERTSALIILLIICLSVGLGFLNEYRSELAVEALHSQLRHRALTMRDGEPVPVDVTELVPGDVVRLAVGDVVPADLRLLRADGLECDEAVLTGESMPAEKAAIRIAAPESPLDLASCAFMGTVVREGSGSGVVVATGGRTEFGAIALQARRATAADRVPARTARLLASARAGDGRAGRLDPRDQRGARPPAARGACCSRSRSRSA